MTKSRRITARFVSAEGGERTARFLDADTGGAATASMWHPHDAPPRLSVVVEQMPVTVYAPLAHSVIYRPDGVVNAQAAVRGLDLLSDVLRHYAETANGGSSVEFARRIRAMAPAIIETINRKNDAP